MVWLSQSLNGSSQGRRVLSRPGERSNLLGPVSCIFFPKCWDVPWLRQTPAGKPSIGYGAEAPAQERSRAKAVNRQGLARVCLKNGSVLSSPGLAELCGCKLGQDLAH